MITPAWSIKLAEACEAFESAGQDGFATLEEVERAYPGWTRVSACEWAVYGLTPEEWLSLEAFVQRQAVFVATLREIVAFYRRNEEALAVADPR